MKLRFRPLTGLKTTRTQSPRVSLSRFGALFCSLFVFLLLGGQAQAQTAYYSNLISSLATSNGTPSTGQFMVGGNENTVHSAPSISSGSSENTATFSLNQSVTGQSFTRKSSGTVQNLPSKDYFDSITFTTPKTSNTYTQGDNILLVVWLRAANLAKGEKGYASAGLMNDNGGTWFASRSLLLTGTWQRFFLYGKTTSGGLTSDGNPLRATFSLSFRKQTVEIAGVAIINYGSNASGLAALNAQGYNYDNYDGKTTAGNEGYSADINANRKVGLTVQVKNANGTDVSGASVQIRQKKHSFGFGGDEDAYYLTDQNFRDARRKSMADTNFDGVANDPWSAVIDQTISRSNYGWDGNFSQLDEAVNWYNDNGYKLVMHTLAWGDKGFIPDNLPKTPATVRARIDTVTKRYAGKVASYHVLNETYNRRAWQESFPTRAAWIAEIAEWFKIARANDPNAKLYLSDNDMLEGGGWNDNRLTFYEKLIADLKAQGAPVDGFAFQAHFGNDQEHYFTDIPRVKAIIDRIAATGVKIRISEFDFFNYSTDAQRAKYLRDFLTVCFANANVEDVLIWDRGPGPIAVWATDPYGVSSGVFYADNTNYQLRATGSAWCDLVYGKYWTNSTKTTGTNGQVSESVFKGDYEIVVTPPGGTAQTVQVKDVTSARTVTVTVGTTPAITLNTNAVPPNYSLGQNIVLGATINGVSLANLKVQYFRGATLVAENEIADLYETGFTAQSGSGGSYTAKAVNIYSGAVVATSAAKTISVSGSGSGSGI